jgi:phenylacetate-coenzyme A ligase PaaK-like adenylate-forming protein
MRNARGALAAPGRSATPKVLSVFGSSPAQMSGAIAATWSSPLLEIVAVSAELSPEALAARMADEQPTELRGYPSSLRRLAITMIADGRPRPAVSLGVSGEVLTPATADLLARAFGVFPSNSWGATEAGWLAFSGADPTRMTVAEDVCIVESVDGTNQPVPDGTFGEAVLLTPLINPAFPLVRYRVDDSVCLERHGDRLEVQVRGRSPGVLTAGSGHVGLDVLTEAVEREPTMADYRIRATDRGVALEVPAGLPADQRANLVARCRPVLEAAGMGAELAIEVGHGPWQSANGKSPRVSPSLAGGRSGGRVP